MKIIKRKERTKEEDTKRRGYNVDLIREIQPQGGISSDYGERIDPITGIISKHTGLDFPAPYGTEVLASKDGIIKEVNDFSTGYGKHIIISHGSRYSTLYGHMSGFNVKKGQLVKKGDIIGYVGSTGYSTGNHLHFEIMFDKKKTDPKPFLEGEKQDEDK